MPRYAAIDIGSNSVRMEAAEVTPGLPVRVLASERQVTRLGASVFRSGRVSAEALDFVSGVLAGMAQTYKKLDVVGVRAVATAAIRDASNQKEFLARASAALENEVEIISGQEEARLIHLGVQNRWPHPEHNLLMIDIGGGSTEIILSENCKISSAYSKPLGALRLTEVFLKTDPPRETELHRMQEYIEERIAPAMRRIGKTSIDRVIGTSASAAAVVCAVNRVTREHRDGADRLGAQTAQIRRLYFDLCRKTLEERRKVVGIGPRRAEIIVPGAAVLLRILEDLGLPSVHYSAAGVRDGIIADLFARGVGRELTQLSREQREMIEEMTIRYGVSLKHARKVARLSNQLFADLQSLHNLPPDSGRLLEAASYLHDIGHYVSDTRHHKHSYYLVSNSDMAGFTEQEREVIANLCRYHRKASPSPEHPNLQPLDPDARRAVTLLAPLLRLADSLDRSQTQRVKSISCQVRDQQVVLELDSDEDVDLELWASERSGDLFRQVYNRDIALTNSGVTASPGA